MALVQIFAKPPVAGKVKTRLITDIGVNAATAVYRFCLQHTIEVVQQSDLDFEIWLSEPSSDAIFANHRWQLQKGNNLGERMLFALTQGLTANPREPVLLIGSDCLDLRADSLHQAMASLLEHDLIFLPCFDGGFAMIGCRTIEQSLFERVAWSSETVLRQTLTNAKELGYRVDLLETVRDIDTLQDLKQYPMLRKLIDT